MFSGIIAGLISTAPPRNPSCTLAGQPVEYLREPYDGDVSRWSDAPPSQTRTNRGQTPGAFEHPLSAGK